MGFQSLDESLLAQQPARRQTGPRVNDKEDISEISPVDGTNQGRSPASRERGAGDETYGLFQLDDNSLAQDNLDSTRLDELGLDSLTATEIRSWLMEHLKVNFPVLKILNGITVGQIVETSLNEMPSTMTPCISQPDSLSEKVSNAANNVPLHQPEAQALSTLSPSSLASTASHLSDAQSSSSEESLEPSCHGPLVAKLPANTAAPVFSAEADLSLSQEMFFVAHTMFEDKTSLNCSGLVQLTCPSLSVADLEIALGQLCQRHEILRTSFLVEDGHAKQAISESYALKLEHHAIENESTVH